MTTLFDKVVSIERSLNAAGVPHAFGGAIALGFHIVEPRATADIDINLFVPDTRAREMFGELPREVAWSDADLRQVETTGQVRLFWDDTPVDLFFSTHPFHDHAASHIEEAPFDSVTIPILGATELTVFKAFFDRTRDWADIEAMIDADTIDIHAAIGWLVDLLGSDDHRVDRLRRLIDRKPPTSEPRFAPKR
jgi:hypothetical protein